jgi:hypothetical protein
MGPNMGKRLRYRKKTNQFVVAVQLDLEMDEFTYRKWGGEQRCKQKDWIVDNNGDVYSVDREVFEKTYRRLRTGIYIKTAPVWAVVAKQAGRVVTKEGASHYQAGDYLVSNNEDGSDAYCITAAKFESMYELDE